MHSEAYPLCIISLSAITCKHVLLCLAVTRVLFTCGHFVPRCSMHALGEHNPIDAWLLIDAMGANGVVFLFCSGAYQLQHSLRQKPSLCR